MRAWPFCAAIVLSLGLAALACVMAPAGAQDLQARAMRGRMAQWVQGYNRSDVHAMLEVLSEDYVEDSQAGPGSADKRAMDKAYRGLFAKYDTHIDCVMDQVYALGDAGFDRGHYTLTLTPKGGGATVTERGTYLEVWSRQDGVWRVRHLTNLAAAAPEALL